MIPRARGRGATGDPPEGGKQETDHMIIELDFDDDIELDDDQIDTDTASREELAKVCISLKEAYDRLDRAWDKRTDKLTAHGLSFCDNGAEVWLGVDDREKASEWFSEALAEIEAA